MARHRLPRQLIPMSSMSAASESVASLRESASQSRSICVVTPQSHDFAVVTTSKTHAPPRH
jgi:hypothetical protein